MIITLIKSDEEYKNGAYYQITKQPYSSVRHNIGRYGEYLIYRYLKNFEETGAKFLFNVYIPKENGKTTEIDVLMICSKGIFVFESKNYSGWIFGNEAQKNWCQVLPMGRRRSHKEHFYNPIMQNRSHIKHLKVFVGEKIPVRSIIVFSNRCTLKKIEIESNDISVINCSHVALTVHTICNQMPNELLSESDILEIYNKLYPYTQIDDFAKAEHVANIHNNLINQTIPQKILSVPVSDEEPDKTLATACTQIENEPEVSIDTDMVENEVEINDKDVVKCPKCDGKLVLRTATRGVYMGNQFYGCSNYPKCKYIQNIDKVVGKENIDLTEEQGRCLEKS